MKMTLIDVVMGWKYMSTSAAKSDARVKLGVPTSSRTSLPARIEIAVPPGREEPALLNTPHPRSDCQDLGERQFSTGRDVHDDSSPVFGHLARRSYRALTNSS